MQLELSQQLCNCDDVKGRVDKDRKIGDGIFGMNILKQNMREKLQGSAEPLGGAAETVEN